MLFDRDYVWSENFDEYVEAASGEWLDQSHSGGVTFVSPGGAVFNSDDGPLTVELHDCEPPAEPTAESVGEFGLLVRSGVLVMEESGGGERRTEVPIPVGRWRARWSGFGETALELQEFSEEGVQDPRPDRYLLQLWPTSTLGPVKRLHG
jgi:hypothetical protein